MNFYSFDVKEILQSFSLALSLRGVLHFNEIDEMYGMFHWGKCAFMYIVHTRDHIWVPDPFFC
jgi:hypothetical protein